jgi:hypothetical protein
MKGNTMNYRIKLVKVTSPHTEREVAHWDIPRIEIKGKSLKIKFLPTLKIIKDSIKKDIFPHENK